MTAAGLVDWPVPRWSDGSRSLTDVPGPLWALLGATVVVTVITATALTAAPAGLRWRARGRHCGCSCCSCPRRRWRGTRWSGPALSATVVGAVIPVLDWLSTLVPALLAGLLSASRGPGAPRAAVLGTGVVTLPLLHLSYVLLISGTRGPPPLALWPTLVFGVLPLALVALVARGWSGGSSTRGSGAAPPSG